jgi:septal ring-binding cell division protein DamX
MEENNKVMVFEKKEIVLLLLFVIVLIITGFTLGIRLGKKLALDQSGVIPADVKAIELKSNLEEDVEKTVADDAKVTDEEKLKNLMDESKARLGDELEKFSSSEKSNDPIVSATSNTSSSSEPVNSSTGKYTIQLGSYNTLDEAKQFAEGFTVRGYSPIINEVKIEGKGNWYRVSLGLFKTVEEAKAYIKTEQSLFSGQDHIISEIK